MKVEPQRLKKFLLDANLVSKEQFDKAFEKAEKIKKNIGDVLVSEGFISQEKLAKFEAYLLGIPFVNLEKEKIPADVLNLIPEPIARAHNIVAFRKSKNELEVAMLDPEDLRTIEFIKKTNELLKIMPRLTTAEGMKNVLRQYTEASEFGFTDVSKSLESNINPADPQDLEKFAQERPVVKIVDDLLKHAIMQKSSDMHIEPLETGVVVRYRIDGILHDVAFLPVSEAMGIVARIKVLSNLKLDEHRLPQDGRFKFETEDFKYSIRVSILPVFNGEKIVMRLLAEDTKQATLDGVGLMGKAFEDVQANLAKPTGMILITGPTGSGKTTTLYSMMSILNTTKVNISTIEDPIEYRMPRINQTQVNAKIGLTFSAGLRSLVRQDPNIIMVGEIRDKETANLAINAALTGHLVLSTLHTTRAGGAVPRLIDMGVEPFLIASTLNVVIGQRLVRKIAGEKKKYKLTSKNLENLARYCDLSRVEAILKKEKLLDAKKGLENVELYHTGPTKNAPDGYSGRIGIFEVLPVDEKIKKLILERATSKEITDCAIKDGMWTMVDDGFVKAAQGATTLEEVLRVITE
jgi:type IV pilus assembly protein PilB